MIKGSSRGIVHRMIPVRCRQYDFERFKPQRSVPYRVYAYDKTFVAILCGKGLFFYAFAQNTKGKVTVI